MVSFNQRAIKWIDYIKESRISIKRERLKITMAEGRKKK